MQENNTKNRKIKLIIVAVSIFLITIGLIVYFNDYSCDVTSKDFSLSTEINDEYVEFVIIPYTDIKNFSVTLKAHTGLVTFYGWEKDILLGNVKKNTPITLRYTYDEVSRESGDKEIRHLSADIIQGKIKNIHQNHKYKKPENTECKVIVTYDGVKNSITCSFTNLTNKPIRKINNICFKTDFNGQCDLEVSEGSAIFNNGLNPGETETIKITEANIHASVVKQVFVDSNVDVQYYVIYEE